MIWPEPGGFSQNPLSRDSIDRSVESLPPFRRNTSSSVPARPSHPIATNVSLQSPS
ncbi:hypothetical protein N658DRAFT_490607 [Parathielavia hyrcaniae]|uniref:Uncharacterized protein n=1 Tax=Parathielavia hyrcaniae TaxID=113614 RepID=A0AAN6T5J8_9PEZI|nr:hypothetical protein N658DRAFT_490607 [Parathielavia hyrcaniae]